MVEIQAPRLVPTLWTSAKFLSKRPIRDAYSMIETPAAVDWTSTDFGSAQSVKKDTR
jgi:hypothetical protein